MTQMTMDILNKAASRIGFPPIHAGASIGDAGLLQAQIIDEIARRLVAIEQLPTTEQIENAISEACDYALPPFLTEKCARAVEGLYRLKPSRIEPALSQSSG